MSLDNQINFRVDDELLDELKAEASSTKSTPSQVIRLAVSRYLEGLKRPKQPKQKSSLPPAYRGWCSETR